MRRFVRLLGAVLVVGGLATIAWALAVWRWEDPFTSLYTEYEQRKLDSRLDDRFATFGVSADASASARRLRRSARIGEGIGRIEVPRLRLRMVLVYGTTHDALKRGPGLDPRTHFPGERRLVYVAGHRTTYGAPFSKINTLRRGDSIRLEMPYGTFTYLVTGSRVVPATDLSVLRSKLFEQIVLQACHPRFFATQRWLTYGRLVQVVPPAAGSESEG
jgi:sortase A